MSRLTVDDLDELTVGATFLGAGGGGDPYIAQLMVRQAIEDFGPVSIVETSELPGDARVAAVAIVGAPTVIVEKVPSGAMFVSAVRALAAYLGHDFDAIMPVEVGGMNTLIPLVVAAEMGIPCVDADGMRRAFPQVEMTCFTLGGIPASPMSLADEKGNKVAFETVTNQMSERLARGCAMMLGLANAVAFYPMTISQVNDTAIIGSMTYCIELGSRLRAVQRHEPNAWAEFYEFTGGVELFSGKVIDVDRQTTDGFAKGTVAIEHFDDSARVLCIELQNELLLATEDDRPIVTPPDLICMLDNETVEPITTEGLAYGQRVTVLGLPCAPEWHRAGMLDLVGPRAFGYDVEYTPLGGAAK